MALQAGTRLGAYEIISPLGAGGMGEVYRARDTKLQRDVALKILPESMARDAQRMARFEREAQVLASLNHPNIAAIYGLEESNGLRALVMELVGGQTLAERLRRAQPLTRPASRDTLSPQAGRGEKFTDLQPAAPGRGKKSNDFTPLPPSGRGEKLNDLTPSPQGRGWSGGAGPGEGSLGSALATDEALPIAKQIAEALEYAHERGVIHRDLKPANVKITPEGTVKVLDFSLAKVLESQDSTTTMDIANSPTLSVMATQAGMILGTAAYMSPEQAKGQRVDRRADIWAFGCVLYEMLSGRKPFEGETISDVLAAVIKSEPDWAALPATTPLSVQRLIRRCLQKDLRQRLQAIGDARITIEETISGTGVSPVVEHGQDAHATVSDRRTLLRRALPWAVVAILLCLTGIAGWWLGTRNVIPPVGWSGELLPGPAIAFWPRVSPDGHLIAFQAMVDNQTQVAVMDPRSGNWTVLTHDRAHGTVASLCWSHDGSTIYFDRAHPQPVGIYSVPSLGGEQRLVLANAASPEALPDGSLLVVRVDSSRLTQLYHYWPGTGHLQPLGAWVELAPSAPIRIVPGGTRAVFFGNAKGESDSSPRLYLLDIATGATRQLAPGLHIVQSSQAFPLAVTTDGRSVLIDLPSGNLHRIVAIPISGQNSFRNLLALTSAPWVLDAAPDGSLYIDQVSRPLEILKVSPSGGTPEVLASVESPPFSAWRAPPLQFADGRLLIPAVISGRTRLLMGKPGGNFVPLLENNEETELPMARIGNDEVAFMAGSSGARELAIASIEEGRIIQRFESTKGKRIVAVAASPDGKELYYVDSGNVWAIPTQGGNSRKICAGDGVAVDSNGHDLTVDLVERDLVHLGRVPVNGGPLQPIHVASDVPISPTPLGSDAVNRNGVLLLSMAPSDSWFWGLAMMDLTSGKLTRIPLNYSGDITTPGWASDGQILATADPIRAHIWRFQPEH